MVYCQNCGSENVDEGKFCVNCGVEIKKVQQPEQKSKREIPQRPEPPQQPRKPAWLSPKSFFSSTVFIVALIVVVAVISFAVGMLMADSFSGGNGGESNHNVSGTVTMSVPEFFDALEVDIDSQNHFWESDIHGVESGDTLEVMGEIDRLIPHNKTEIEEIGEYTTVMLIHNKTSVLPVHAIGNITTLYDAGDEVVITLHVLDLSGPYVDMTNTTWQLSGKFFQEQFIFGTFAFDAMRSRLIVAPDQIKEI